LECALVGVARSPFISPRDVSDVGARAAKLVLEFVSMGRLTFLRVELPLFEHNFVLAGEAVLEKRLWLHGTLDRAEQYFKWPSHLGFC